jgi:DNA-binding NtrC family response regulator
VAGAARRSIRLSLIGILGTKETVALSSLPHRLEPARIASGGGLSANVVIVHDEAVFLDQAATALRHAGFNVVAFADPIDALSAVEAGQPIDVLVTRVTFPEGRPHGVSLALVLRRKYPGLRVVFTGRVNRIEHTESIGELVPHPVDLEKLVAAVARAGEGVP